MSLLGFLILVLASYRIARLIAVDDITSPLRERTHGWLAELVGCPFCVGVWVSAALVLLVAPLLELEWQWLVLTIAAVAGGQAALASVDGALNG